VKRELNIRADFAGNSRSLLAAVLYGTGKSSFDRGGDEMPLGKTGTCDDHTTPSKIGWFLTYADDAHPKIALAVLLPRKHAPSKRATAAVVAGESTASSANRIILRTPRTPWPSIPAINST